ncbi:hypothetical protein KW511_21725 [Vibrio fluvialis]|nr:hypothetical protein [Vibrio fluvialis]
MLNVIDKRGATMIAIYIISAIAMLIGLMTLYAPNIEKWCDKQLAKKNDKNAP